MDRRDDRGSEFQEKIVSLNRVAKVVKGGRRFSFSALVVVGDGKGRVGAGLGKAGEVPDAIRKGVDDAKKHMITVPMVGTTIPHEVRYKLGAAKVMLKPGVPGTGVISGSSMRAVVEAAGIKDILTKSLGTDNPINVVRATVSALASLRTLASVAELRGRTPEQIVGSRKMADRMLGRTPAAARCPGRSRSSRREHGSRDLSQERHRLRVGPEGAPSAALGLKKLNHTVEHEATPSIRGMVHKVRHLVAVNGEPADSPAGVALLAELAPNRRAQHEASRAEPGQGQPQDAQAGRPRPGRRPGQDQRSRPERPGIALERRASHRFRRWPDAAQAAAAEASRLPQPLAQ